MSFIWSFFSAAGFDGRDFFIYWRHGIYRHNQAFYCLLNKIRSFHLNDRLAKRIIFLYFTILLLYIPHLDLYGAGTPDNAMSSRLESSKSWVLTDASPRALIISLH